MNLPLNRFPLKRPVVAIVTGAMMLWPAGAQAVDGIGFAQAEEGTWYCRGDNPVATLNCAREKCRAESGGQECLRTKWCFPAGWSGLMTVNLSDFHTTEIVCGAPSEPAVRAALKSFCAGNEFAVSCSISLLIDPEGKDLPQPGKNFPGPKAN
ncbi:MAG: hypothetical protein OER56_02040 [Hyphomicrobiales bacterium]|nr:hypothetical protein [Hyphomicrobiales bacterium]